MSSLDTKFGKRKTVNMNEDIAQELNKLANSSGKTLYSLTNEIAICALEANRLGFSLEDAVAAKKMVQSAKRSRMVLVNQDLWYYASSLAIKASQGKWLKLIRDCAQWQANVFLDASTDKEFIESLRRLLTDFFWDCSEVKLEAQGADGLAMRLAFVPEMPLEHTRGLFKVFEGMFNVHDYVVTDTVVKPGFLAITLKKIGSSPRKPSQG